MKKKTLIIVASLVYTVILFVILLYRLYLINSDTTGLFELKDESIIYFILTFLPEISILAAMLAANLKRGIGLVFTFAAGALTVGAFIIEMFIKLVKSVDIAPPPVVPWLNIPVLIIVIILFFVKVHILNLPDEVSFKSKKRK